MFFILPIFNRSYRSFPNKYHTVEETAGLASTYVGSLHIVVKKEKNVFLIRIFCPQAGLALPFPFDEKEAKISSKRTCKF